MILHDSSGQPIYPRKLHDASGTVINPAKEDGNLAALAGKDFATQTTLASVLSKLDITLGALRDALKGASAKDFSTLEVAVDVATSTLIENLQPPVLHRNAITAPDDLDKPATPSLTDVATGGSLLANTTYYVKVTAVNDNGETDASAAASIITAADASDTHQITVSWAAIVGAKSYNIYLSTDADPKYQGNYPSSPQTIGTAGTGAVAPAANTAWAEPATADGVDCSSYQFCDFDVKLSIGGTNPVLSICPIIYDSVDAQWYKGESTHLSEKGKYRIRVEARGAIVFLQARELTGTSPTFTLSAWAVQS